ncbi:MAG TPA: hypothetical protein VFR35_17885, partial [Actinoplanes sp.]|nr:hypothetical protein [Actinoplanes sp.]
FSYKAGFSPCRHPFHTWRLVADPAAYQRLVRERNPQALLLPAPGPSAGAENPSRHGPADRTATFPPYR